MVTYVKEKLISGVMHIYSGVAEEKTASSDNHRISISIREGKRKRQIRISWVCLSLKGLIFMKERTIKSGEKARSFINKM